MRALGVALLVCAWAGCHDANNGGGCGAACDMACSGDGCADGGGGTGGGGGGGASCGSGCDMACASGCGNPGGDMACSTSSMCGGSATNLCSDGANCGICGHDCQGGTCAGGSCQPVEVTPQQANPYDVAVDGANVYWSEHSTMNVDGSLATQAKSGGAVTPLASSQWGPRRVLTLNGNVYWSNYYAGEVWQIAPAPAGTTTQIVGAAGQLNSFAVDGARAYYILMGGTVISSTPLDGSKTSTVITTPALSGQKPTALATDGTSVFWVNSGDQSIRRTPVAGGAAALVADNLVQPGLLALWNGDVYFTTATTISKVSGAGGTPTPVVTGFTKPVTALVVDGDGLYWTHYLLGTVQRLRFSDGVVLTVASGQANPQGLATDATTIYWGNFGTIGMSDGAIMKAAK